jgi:hypothetical protein
MGRAAGEACRGSLECWERSEHLLEDRRTKKSGVEMAGRSTLLIDTDCWQVTLRWRGIAYVYSVSSFRQGPGHMPQMHFSL